MVSDMDISHCAVIRYHGLKGLTPKGIHEEMVTLGENVPLYSMVRKWAIEFKRGRRFWKTILVREGHTGVAKLLGLDLKRTRLNISTETLVIL